MMRMRRITRNVLAAASLAVALLAPSLAWGAGGTYEVVQCDPLNRGVAGLEMQDAPAYAVKQMCDDPKADHAIKVSNTRFARYGRLGSVRWSTGSPVLRIVGVDTQAWLRRDNGHAPRLFMADGEGHEVARVAAGTNKPTDFRNYSWRSSTLRPQQFVARLRCEGHDGCRQSKIAKAWLRNVHFRVADYADPALQTFNGNLLRPGWIRGSQSVFARGSDMGSGIQRIALMVNRSLVLVEPGACNGVLGASLSVGFRPCQAQRDLGDEVATAAPPFHDGRNEIAACAIDFALNGECVERTVRVDNSAPTISFANTQKPNDPELIRAPAADSTSGIRAGRIYYRPVGASTWRSLDTVIRPSELRARIDSTVDPPGSYEFLAVARDAAGNTTRSTEHADGRPMVLTFPLKAGIRLSGHLAGGTSRQTIEYGRPSTVAGVLTNAAGQPLSNEEVTITEYFGEGALIDRRIRTVTTDTQGHWRERLPSGPSRNIRASYSGTRRYLSGAAKVGSLRVRTKATLRLSRRKVSEGHRVAFKGRVSHLAARIPTGGKLVELEVKNGKSWQTVRHPFYTRPNGRYKLHYRFARFYTSNVHYRFRIRVLREHAWPYKAPSSSRVRKLVVRAR